MCLHVCTHGHIRTLLLFPVSDIIDYFTQQNSVVVYSCDETIFMTYTGNHFLVDLWLFSQVT